MQVRLLKREWELKRLDEVAYSLMPIGEKELDGGLMIVETSRVPVIVDVDWWLKPNLYELLLTQTYKAMKPEVFLAAREGDAAGVRRVNAVLTRFVDAMNLQLGVIWNRKPYLPRPR